MQPLASNSNTPDPASTRTQITAKTFIEEFGDTVQVDSITYLECVIAHKRGATFKWIKDVDNISYKIFLKDQDFNQ